MAVKEGPFSGPPGGLVLDCREPGGTMEIVGVTAVNDTITRAPRKVQPLVDLNYPHETAKSLN